MKNGKNQKRKMKNEIQNRIDILQSIIVKMLVDKTPPKFKVGDIIKLKESPKYEWMVEKGFPVDGDGEVEIDGIILNLRFSTWRNSPYKYRISLKGMERINQIVYEEEII